MNAALEAAATRAEPVRHLELSGVDLEVWSRGSGRDLLILHPGDGPAHDASYLEELSQRHRVIMPSHPGFGGSSLPEFMNSVDDLAYFYLDFIESQGLRDYVLIGFSFGAWIACEIAIRSQSGMAGLMLVDALGAKFEGPRKREILDLFSYPQYEQAKLIYHDPARQEPDYRAWDDASLQKMARGHASFALFAWSPTLHSPKLRHRLHRITVPTHIVWGAEDRVVPPDYGRRFAAAIPGSTFRLIEGAGHYPQVERAAEFVREVDGFVDSLSIPKAQKTSQR
jgi:pimeloyl-ACP methyl ester carboxylesterase